MKDFQEIQDRIGEWSDKKWNSDDPRGTIAHMLEEVEHLLANPYNAENFADVGILLLVSLRRAGMTIDEFYQAIEAKHNINLSRIWDEPDELGITRHKKI